MAGGSGDPPAVPLLIKTAIQSVIVSPSPLAKIARVVVCFNHIARFIVNANHGIIAFDPPQPSSGRRKKAK